MAAYDYLYFNLRLTWGEVGGLAAGPGGPAALMWRIGTTATKWPFDIMANIPELYEIYDNEKRGDRPAYLPARLPGA